MAGTHVLSVAYPKSSKFDLDYYLKTHMPLVQEKWSKYGLKSWRVVNYTNPDVPYIIQAFLEFESQEHVATATSSPEAKEVFGDVANFYDKEPVTLLGPLAGSWTKA